MKDRTSTCNLMVTSHPRHIFFCTSKMLLNKRFEDLDNLEVKKYIKPFTVYNLHKMVMTFSSPKHIETTFYHFISFFDKTKCFLCLSAINNISSFYDDSAVFFHNKLYTWYDFCFHKIWNGEKYIVVLDINKEITLPIRSISE